MPRKSTKLIGYKAFNENWQCNRMQYEVGKTHTHQGAHSATSQSDTIACAIGRKAKAKAPKGAFIVLAEWHEGAVFTDAYPIAVKSAKVDGKKIKADQWYKLVDGKFVETDDSND